MLQSSHVDAAELLEVELRKMLETCSTQKLRGFYMHCYNGLSKSDHVVELKVPMNDLEKTFKEFEFKMTKPMRRLLAEVCGASRVSLQQESKTFLGLGGSTDDASKSQHQKFPDISINQLHEIMSKAHLRTNRDSVRSKRGKEPGHVPKHKISSTESAETAGTSHSASSPKIIKHANKTAAAAAAGWTS